MIGIVIRVSVTILVIKIQIVMNTKEQNENVSELIFMVSNISMDCDTEGSMDSDCGCDAVDGE